MLFLQSQIQEYIIHLSLCKGLQNSDLGALKVDKCSFQRSPFFFSLIILHKSCSYTVIAAFFSPSIGISGSPSRHPPDKFSLLSFSAPLSTAEQEVWIVLPYLLISCGSHYQAFACSSWICAVISVVSCEGKNILHCELVTYQEVLCIVLKEPAVLFSVIILIWAFNYSLTTFP